LHSDKRAIFRAAAAAQPTSDYILAFHPDYVAKHPEIQCPALEQPASASLEPTL
jgi:antirestriction protein ArdC